MFLLPPLSLLLVSTPAFAQEGGPAAAAPPAETPEQAQERQRQEALAAYAASVLPRFGAGELDPAQLPPLAGQAVVTTADLASGREWLELDAGGVPAQRTEPLCGADEVLVIGHPSDRIEGGVPAQLVLDSARAARLGAEVWYAGTLEPTTGSGYAVCVPTARVLPDRGWVDSRLTPVWAAIADHEGRLQGLEGRVDGLEDGRWSLSLGASAWALGTRYGALGVYGAVDAPLAGAWGLRAQGSFGRAPGQQDWAWSGYLAGTRALNTAAPVQVVVGVGNTDLIDRSWHARAKNYGLMLGAAWAPNNLELQGGFLVGPWLTPEGLHGPPVLRATPHLGVGYRF